MEASVICCKWDTRFRMCECVVIRWRGQIEWAVTEVRVTCGWHEIVISDMWHQTTCQLISWCHAPSHSIQSKWPDSLISYISYKQAKKLKLQNALIGGVTHSYYSFNATLLSSAENEADYREESVCNLSLWQSVTGDNCEFSVWCQSSVSRRVRLCRTVTMWCDVTHHQAHTSLLACKCAMTYFSINVNTDVGFNSETDCQRMFSSCFVAIMSKSG